jgi:hypothetical protein
VGKAVFDMGVIGGTVAGALAADESDDLTPQAAQALFFVDDAFFIGAEFMALVFMAAAGVVILWRRALPVWLGWLALLKRSGCSSFRSAGPSSCSGCRSGCCWRA